MKKFLLTAAAFGMTGASFAGLPLMKWTRGFGGSGNDIANNTFVDAAGNTYVTGMFSGTVDFDASSSVHNLVSNGSSDMFILKLDMNGDFVWAYNVGGSGDDEGTALMTDLSGNLYVSGTYEGTVDFDPGVGNQSQTSVGGTDAFVLKLDASGNFSWVRSMGGTTDDEARSLMLDLSGNVYVGGSFTGSSDFDGGSGTTMMSSAGGSDGFVVKLDGSGSFQWVRTMGGSSNDFVNALTLDLSGNLVLTGSFMGTGDFDPGSSTSNLTSNGMSDIFVNKLDGSGNFMFATSFGGLLQDEGRDIATDATGNIILTGSFNGLVDFEPGSGTTNLLALGGRDAFVLNLNSTGNLNWVRNMGGLLDDEGRSVMADATGNIYLTGYFQGISDFDGTSSTSNLTSVGLQDAFLTKLDASGMLQWAHNMGSTGADWGSAIALDMMGNITSVGSFSGSGDFSLNLGLFTLSNPGSGQDIYTQRVTQDGTFINETASVAGILPYPNPTANVVYVELNQTADIEVFNGNGQMIWRKTAAKGKTVVDLGQQASGTYFLSFTGKESQAKEFHTIQKF